MRKNKKIVLTAILLAMLVLLSRFLSIKTPITKISFAFVPTMLCAIWLGPKWTIICITNLADEILIANRTPILDNGKIALERQVNKVKNVIIFLIFIFYATLLFFMPNNIELIVFGIINLTLMIIIKVNLKKAKEILDKTNGVLLDVRSHQEYNEEHLPGAININLYDLKKEITDKIKNKETTIVVYCSCGVRSKKAKEILEELGYTEVYNLKEGLYCYRKEL